MATIVIAVEDQYLDALMDNLAQSPMRDKFTIAIQQLSIGNGIGPHVPINGQESQKLTHEELMAMPVDEMLDYCKMRGGVFTVMHENGFALTDADLADWQRYQAEEDALMATLSWDEAIKHLHGDK
jgi:hypothetical protein